MPKLLFQEEGAVKYDFMSVTLNFKLDFFMKNKGESPKILINVMKKTFVQFIFSIIFVSISAANDSHAQGILNQKISLSLEDVTIKEVLQEIEEWMDVKFSYNSRKISINERISINIKENELSDVKDENGDLRPLKVSISSRTFVNKLLYIVYKLLRTFYVSLFYYFMPFSAIIISTLFPIIFKVYFYNHVFN